MATYGYQIEDDIVEGEGSSSDEDGAGTSQGFAPSYLTYGCSAPNQDVKYWIDEIPSNIVNRKCEQNTSWIMEVVLVQYDT